MEYPVYLQMTETENVVAVQGPSRFWEGQNWANVCFNTTWFATRGPSVNV